MMQDLTSKRWIVAKGIMFAAIVVMAGIGTLVREELWIRLLMLIACIWAACRFYYFLFYVLEHYVGVEGKYAGIFDLVVRLMRKRREAKNSSGDM